MVNIHAVSLLGRAFPNLLTAGGISFCSILLLFFCAVVLGVLFIVWTFLRDVWHFLQPMSTRIGWLL